jgi:hypothetical protein
MTLTLSCAPGAICEGFTPSVRSFQLLGSAHTPPSVANQAKDRDVTLDPHDENQS